MSKKNRKYRNQNKAFPWPLIAVGSVIVLIAAFLLINQNSDRGGTPSIAVDQQQIQFGDVKFDTPKTFAIKVTNTGVGVLRFQDAPYIQVVEGC
ncbi:MAG: hypothetical protein AB1649_10980 [Chloroflexota bacterium]